MIRKNDVIKLNIDDMTNLGFGVGRHDGQVVFVSDAVTGDELLGRIIKVNKSYAVGRVEKFIKKSPTRCEGRCPITACKSCAYRHISYAEELRLKHGLVKGAFQHEGLNDVKIEDVVPSPSTVGYRNKAQYPIQMDKNGEYVIGFYAPRSHRVTEARACPLAPEIFERILNTLSEIFRRNALSVYNEDDGKGLLRHVYLRRGEISGEVLLTLVINGTALPGAAEDDIVRTITAAYPEVVGILINTNTESTNVVLGGEWRTIYGRDYVFDTLGGVRLKITAPSFYQVNRAAADLLYRKAAELAATTPTDTLLDLFCGAGSIGLSMADSCGELIGIEIIDSAVICARENAAANGKNDAKFYTGDASDCEKLLEGAERELGRSISPDVVILDPPRAGCTERLINFIASLAPKRVVYVSCNPATLARDCAVFKALGFICDVVTPFDLFPGTGHVESLVCLAKQTN